jgi:Holliday junction resolvase RusA-like endonuclease
MISITIKCVPPSITAQQKRVTFVNGKPRFFHGGKMQEQTATWTSLLQPHQPAEPMDGPLELAVRLVYPHLKSTRKNDVHRLLPKTTKPDAGNASKHLEDLLARMRFITDDARISRLIVEKYWGPSELVGIQIRIDHLTVGA